MTLTQFSLYFLIATVIQFLLLMFIRQEKIGSRNLYSLVVLFITQNAIYLCTSVISESNFLTIEILVRVFYVASFLSVGYFLSYAIEIATVKRSSYIGQIENGVWLVALCCVILSVFTDEIITGYRPLSFTVTALQGDSFWIRQTHAIFALLAACMVLFGEWGGLRQSVQRSRYLFVLAGYFSFTASSLIAAMMMRYGGETYFAIVFPFSTTFFICLIVYGNFKYRSLTDDEKSVLQQYEMSDDDQLNDIFTGFTGGRYSFNEASEKINFLLLRHSFDKHDESRKLYWFGSFYTV